jgi:hypothetical protein
LALFKGPNSIGVSLPSPEVGNRFSFQVLCFTVFRIPNMDKAQKPSNAETVLLIISAKSKECPPPNTSNTNSHSAENLVIRNFQKDIEVIAAYFGT